MLTYEKAKLIALSNTIPDGKVYYAGDAGDFYIFKIVEKNVRTDVKGLTTGPTFTAVNKADGLVWTVYITDPRLKDVKKLLGPTKQIGGESM